MVEVGFHEGKDSARGSIPLWKGEGRRQLRFQGTAPLPSADRKSQSGSWLFGGFNGGLPKYVRQVNLQNHAHAEEGFQRRIPQFMLDKTDHGSRQASSRRQFCHGQATLNPQVFELKRDLGANGFPQLRFGHDSFIPEKSVDSGRYYSNVSACLPEDLD
jgi:hypothetical protein